MYRKVLSRIFRGHEESDDLNMYTYNGENIKLSIYGGSHEPVIGMRLSGIKRGIKIDRASLNTFMARRAPGKNEYSTPRREEDVVEFLSGVSDDVTDGGEIHAIIRSSNQRNGSARND